MPFICITSIKDTPIATPEEQKDYLGTNYSMASRYGRKGTFSPDDRKLMEDNNMQSDDSDEKEPPAEKSGSKRRTTSTVPTAKKTASKANTVNEIVGSPSWNGEGCKVCHKDSDHPNLLLCESCK